MINQELVNYIATQIASGLSEDEIKKSLLPAGWPESDIAEALSLATKKGAEANSLNNMNNQQNVETMAGFSFSDQIDQGGNKGSRFGGRKLILSLGLVLASLLVGGGAWGFVHFYVNSPDKVIANGLENLKDVNTFTYNLDLEFNLKGSSFLSMLSDEATNESAVFTVNLEGQVDISQLDKSKANTKALIKYISGANVMALGAQLRKTEDMTYVQFTDIPNLGIFDLSSLKNKWIKIEPKKLAEDFASNGDKASSLLDGLSDEQIEQLSQVLRDTEPIEIKARLPKEDVAGLNSFHYQLQMNPEKFRDFMTRSVPIVTRQAIDDEQKQQIDEMVDEMSREAQNIEVWVSSKGRMLNKIKLDIPASKSDDDLSSIFAGGTATLTLSKFNEAFTVETPASSVTFEELFGDIFGFMDNEEGEEMMEYFDQDNDQDGLNVYVEDYYGTSDLAKDSDGDSYSDIEEIKNGYNPAGPGVLSYRSSAETSAPMEESRIKSRDARRVADIKQLQTALELYYADTDKYPVSPSTIILGQTSTKTLSSNAGFSPSPSGTVYMGLVPENTMPGGLPYKYQSSDGQAYTISFALENDVGGLVAGVNIASPEGIISQNR